MPPHIYTIDPDRPFLVTLAQGLLALASGDPLALSRITVLLPTRRAARALREAFLRLTATGREPGAPLLLPRLRPIGDLDNDEVALGLGDAAGSDDPSLAIPPAIPELRRRLLLTRLVLRWSKSSRAGALLPGQAASLAAALARLLDAAESEEQSFAKLPELVPEELAAHWQTVLEFLRLLPDIWPGVLTAEGALDPADRRNLLLRRQAALWRQTPPAAPVVAAGLTGGIPALVELLSVVAWSDQGRVILPGLDRGCGEDQWGRIGDESTHPQHVMARLLARLEIDRDEVRDWPPDQPSATATGPASRLALVAQALRPAELTDAWRGLPPQPAEALAGLTRYECASAQDEAATIALLLRRQLETPAATAALITPDRELARRVATELRRWNIDIDDSAGTPISHTPPGVFLRLVLDVADNALAPVPLLAALKHPLAAGGLAPEEFRDLARRLEAAIRGPRPAPGIAGLKAALKPNATALIRFVERLENCLGRLLECLARASVPLTELIVAHIAAAEALARSDDESGVARLWRDAAGEAAARLCHEMIDAASDFPPLAGRDYPALFAALAAGTVVRPNYARHPRLAIWGLVEARLQQADLLVLGGLNEGTWPGPAAYDPWMSRQMRQEFGIAPPERAIGIAAHDFAQALGAPVVALTRATRDEGAPTVPSRWLLRLDTVLRAVGLDGALTADPEIVAAAASQDQAASRGHSPAVPPAPRLAARPRRLSVTEIETWLRDPYAIYARHILRLRALDELDAEPGRAELGIAVHDALAKFVRRYPRELPLCAEEELVAIGRRCFDPMLSRPGVWAFWWPRFLRIARWFIAAERRRRAAIVESLSECRGELVIAAPGGPFTITGIADRIDRLENGELVLIDYKTGSLPLKRDIDDAVAVQLPLEGAIARDGDFGGLSGVAAALEYWRLAGADPAGEISPVPNDDDPAPLIDKVLGEVTALIRRFDDPTTPYPPVPDPRLAPRFSDYRHLERLDEAEPEPDGEE